MLSREPTVDSRDSRPKRYMLLQLLVHLKLIHHPE